MAIRILILEDDPDYRRLLKDLYKNILNTDNDDVVAVDDPQAALACLRSREFRLLSLDINLSQSIRADAEGAFPEHADGSRVLETAVSEGLDFGCIVFTLAPMDMILERVVAEEGRRAVIQTALGDFLDEKHPGRHCYFLKRSGATPQEKKENVDLLGQRLSKGRLLELSLPYKMSVKLYMKVPLDGSGPKNASITEFVNGRQRGCANLTDRRYVDFFWWLAQARKAEQHEPIYLTNATIARIFLGESVESYSKEQQNKKGQQFADTIKRNVEQKGISKEAWKMLVERIRNQGLRLLIDATGLGGSAGTRGRGGPGGDYIEDSAPPRLSDEGTDGMD